MTETIYYVEHEGRFAYHLPLTKEAFEGAGLGAIYDDYAVSYVCTQACHSIDTKYTDVINTINPVAKQLEHQLAYAEAVAYLLAHDEGNENDEKDENNLDAHAEVYNVSTKEAAQLIKEKGDMANTQLLAARTLRLAGKKAIYDAIDADSSADLHAVITPFIKQLGELVDANT